jgi:hypothetical protein
MSRWLTLAAAAAQKRDFGHTRFDKTDETRQNPPRDEQKGNAGEVSSGFVGFVGRGVGENRISAPLLSAPAPDMVATILETFPQSTVVGEAEPLEAVVLRWLGEGAAVEALGGGYRLTLADGRSLTITAEGAATLDDGLRGDLAERVAIATEHLARPRSWASLDPPPQGAWCAACRGGRFWREREAPRGWRCGTCHPHDHLPVAAVVTAP